MHSTIHVYGLCIISLLAIATNATMTSPPTHAEPLLALPGPLFPRFAFKTDVSPNEVPLTVNGSRILLAQTSLDSDSHEVQTSTSVWDCAVVLLRILEHARNRSCDCLPWLSNDSVRSALEVGAGQGLTGIGFNILFPDITTVITDVADVLPTLRANLELNHLTTENVSAQALDWTRAKLDAARLVPQTYDLILAADVVWMDHLVVPLVTALLEITHTGSHVLLAHQTRSLRTEQELFALLERDFERHELSRTSWPSSVSHADKIAVYDFVRHT
eukprot:TRINITY_DN26963_c0_g1_i1.p1 TRINITY_DN26963_c0_g1~~TRINITY_DN26963_c0_g1_i1.p1  ORF type:complete len:274 (+),score=25.72 TRINITY_DN26963_c0_g1_i1:29-850(+)